MFRPNFRAVFRPIFEEVECANANVFNLRDLLLQELGKITVAQWLRCCATNR